MGEPPAKVLQYSVRMTRAYTDSTFRYLRTFHLPDIN